MILNQYKIEKLAWCQNLFEKFFLFWLPKYQHWDTGEKVASLTLYS